MSDVVQPSDCVRAREDASARLDGELAELDAARLRAHLQQCAECHAFAEEIERVAALLRGAPLEQTAIGARLEEPQPRTALRVVALVAAAVVAVAAAAAASRAPMRAVRFVPSGAFAQLNTDRIPPSLRGLRRELSLFVAT
jgi:predicted anti-sigma-YlaC factor YlaD